MANLGDVSQVKMPNGDTANIKDAMARTATQWLDKLDGSKNLLSIYTFERASMYADVQSDGCTVHVHGTGSGVDLTYGTFTVPETGEYSALISIKSGTVTSLYLKTGSVDGSDLKNATTPTSLGSLTQGTVYELKTWTGTGATVDFTVSILICKTGVLESGLTDFRPPALSNASLTTATSETYDRVCSKNLLPVSSGSGTRWVDINCDIPAGDLVLSFGSFSSTYTADTYQMGFFDENYQVVTTSATVWMNASTKVLQVTTTATTKILRVYASLTTLIDKVVTFSNAMVCTKADWDVSHDYVPYNTLDGTTLPMAVKELSDADGQKNLAPVNSASSTATGYFGQTNVSIPAGTYIISYKLTTTGQFGLGITIDGTAVAKNSTSPPYSNTLITHEITANTGITFYQFYSNGAATVADFMICTKAQWDISHEYQPYALPNVKLTPALIECVDSGKKNVFNTNPSSTPPSGITVNNDGTITINGTFSSATEFSLGSIGTGSFNGYYLTGCTGGSNSTYSLLLQYRISGGAVQTLAQTNNPVEINLNNITWSALYVRIEAGQTVNTVIKPMLCRKELWDVSQKYVPYAMDNVELTAKEQTNEANISISPKVLYYVSQSVSATTTLGDTGVHFNIPAYNTVRLTANLSYSATGTNPVEIVLATVSGQSINTMMAHNTAVTGDNVSNLATMALIGGYNNDMDVYVWAKVKTAGTAFVRLIAEGIPNPN